MKKRILIPIVGQGSIIHIIRTGLLDQIADFCTPVIGLLWEQKDLMEELNNKGYEYSLIPKYEVSPVYSTTRAKIDIWYRMTKVKTPSVSIQNNYLKQFRRKGFRSYKKDFKETLTKVQLTVRPRYINHLLQKEQSLIREQQCYQPYKKWLSELKIEGLFTVTPFLAEVDLMARLLKEKDLPILASIHSFDNVTKRGWASTFFDHYIVWNKYNKSELERINPLLKERNAITIAGAAQFDFHFNQKYVWTREEWLQKLALPSGKKVILYSGGPVSLLPDEPQYLQHLREAFDDNKLPADSIILFRCHPLDKKERWIKYVGVSEHIVYDTAPNGEKKLDHINVIEEDIIKLMSTLKYSDVHINTVSTMSVDGSAFNKPQIGPYYDLVRKNKEHLFRKMYHQEHYQPILKTNVVKLANNKDEFVSIVNTALQQPENFSINSEACLKEIITYTDGRSTSRAVEAIKTFFAR